MRNVRVWFRKDGACRFISHLDINRVMMRALQMSGIPLWHTEGYNSRLYLSFALPLSLGFRGEYGSMDIKLLEDDYSFEKALEKINAHLPEGLTVYKITEQIMKPSVITYGLFKIKMTSEELPLRQIYTAAQAILNQDAILVEKKSKKGMKQVDLKQGIVKYNIVLSGDFVSLDVILPAGNTVNVNPSLIVSVIEEKCGCGLFADITRKELYNESFEPFK